LTLEEKEKASFAKGFNNTSTKRFKRTNGMNYFEGNWPLDTLDFGPGYKCFLMFD